MIYEGTDKSAQIRQGDIFVDLPRTDLSLRRMVILEDADRQVVTSWGDIVKDGKAITALIGILPVTAIVISQDCDTTHGRDISLCEIREFQEVEQMAKTPPGSIKAWVRMITQQARKNQKWFYLPPGDTVGFTKRMAVDFQVTLRVPRADLEDYRGLRVGRLNPVADEHFRERISEFFRRYPYDEWYALSPAEFEEYKKESPEAEPKPWQLNTDKAATS